ncbi:hypothetical protein ABIC42_001011 [Variovorax sp. 1133]|nr:hypothetical protein [Variovorax paradoxus]
MDLQAGGTQRRVLPTEPDKGVPIPQGLVFEQPLRGADAFSFLSFSLLFVLNRSPAP